MKIEEKLIPKDTYSLIKKEKHLLNKISGNNLNNDFSICSKPLYFLNSYSQKTLFPAFLN